MDRKRVGCLYQATAIKIDLCISAFLPAIDNIDTVTIVLIDDHALLRMGLAQLVQSLGYTVNFEADNSREFINKLDSKNLPDLVLMDINIPEMDGFETTQWLKENHPDIKVLALSMYDNENSIIRML